MADETHEQLRRLFDLVIAAPSDERDSILERECAGDDQLRRRITAMVAAAEDDLFLGSPTQEFQAEDSDPNATIPDNPALRRPVDPSERPGQHIGHYKLLQQIGEGGFGTVFMAEQEKPVSRKVALKIIKLGMDTKQVIARFEAERQALAVMDHPNIAKVLDAGATDTGRPYFVMELCKGEAIVEYCDKHNLNIQDRLDLFSQVCTAVQHAHTKGIIHRDIKPSNILVSTQDGRPHAKVIDFGIAKATASKLTEKTLFTEHRQLIGTPEYMSPEQAEGSLDIDTRTDVYSLGVLLYELLTGTTPFSGNELRSAAYAEIQRIIREVEPPKPSTRLSSNIDTLASVAAKRHTEPKRLGTIVRGDLDWIVMKALDKDRHRRYETANGLAMDVDRYLKGEAVLAAPPSTAYRVRKFVRRHRSGVMAASLVVLALTLGMAGTTWGMVQAGRQRSAALAAEQDARAEADRATKAEQQERRRSDQLEQVARFQADQLGAVDASVMGVGLHTDLLKKVREAAQRSNPDQQAAAARAEQVERLVAGADFTGLAFDALEQQFITPSLKAIHTKFKDQPLVRARLLESLAKASLDIGINRSMTGPHQEALQIRRRLLGDDDPATIESISTAGWLEMKASHLDAAERLFREAMERSARVLGENSREHISCMGSLAIDLDKASRDDEARKLREKAYELARRNLGEEDPKTIDLKQGVAISLIARGRPDLAAPMLREVLEAVGKTNPPDSNALAAPLIWLSICLSDLGRREEAEPFCRRAVELNRRYLGDDHPTTVANLSMLGWLHRKMHRYEEAERELTEAYERRKRLVGEDHQDTLCSLRNLGQLALERQQFEKAESLSGKALEGMRRVLGNHHMDTYWTEVNLGLALVGLKRPDEAEVYFREVAASTEDYTSSTGTLAVRATIQLSKILSDRGRFADSAALLKSAYRRCQTSLTASHEPAVARVAQIAHRLAAELASLYEGWNSAEPGKGYDTKAAEWKAKLEAAPPAPDSK